MKLLKKVQLVNWHYFTFETLDLGVINFLTGKNASGKTTIIDALQLIMLGDTTGHSFNKSASDKSSRTLNGYLRCEIGNDENGNISYLRKGHFFNYVVAEIFDDVENKPFTIGCVFECFDDLNYNYKFFTYNDKFPSTLFVNGRQPVELKKLREYIFEEFKDNANLDFTTFETNTSYREFLKHSFGDIGSNYFSLFKKAIPFSPITNIESFITDYVCDVRNNIDISSMQENIRNYTQLEQEAAVLKERVGQLANICELHNNWFTQKENLAVKRYVKYRAQKHIRAKQLDTLKNRLEEVSDSLHDYEEILDTCRKKLSEYQAKKEKLLIEKASSNDFQQRALLENQVNDLNNKIKDVYDRIDFVVSILSDLKTRWIKSLDSLNSSIYGSNFAEIQENALTLKQLFAGLNVNKNNLNELSHDSLFAIQEAINTFKDNISNEIRKFRSEARLLQDQIDDLKMEVNTLREGKKNYDSRLIKLRDLIQDGLYEKHGKNVEVNILADLLEIKHELWRRPIETYLGPQRFYLFLDEEYFNDALVIYNQYKDEYNLNDFGIVDSEKILKVQSHLEKGCLAEEISTSNKYARKFIDNLLGTLIKCDDVRELRKYRRSITSSGMIYQNFVARQLNLNRTVPFIGNNASKNILNAKEHEIKDLTKELDNYLKLISQFEIANQNEIISTNEINNLMNTINSCNEVTSLENEYDSIKKRLNSFGSDVYFVQIDKDLENIDLKITELKAEEESLISSVTQCKMDIESLTTNEIPTATQALEEISSIMEAEFKKVETKSNGEALFLDELAIHRSPNIIYNNYNSQLELVENHINNLYSKLLQARMAYNTQFKTDYEATIEDNEVYEKEYTFLSESKIAEYEEKIKLAKESALKQFKDNFLAKLKSNFDTVKLQINNLNHALESSRFGNDSYKFTMTPRNDYRSYYDMINDPLLLEGESIFSDAFQEKYGEVIDELFGAITYVDYLSTDTRADIEENIARYTDYRSYLKFDLLVIDQNGKVEHLSRSLTKKSGGETQTPFYISILASFSQLYKINEGKDHNNTIRLIVFDEAFSKMDSERITESVKLLKNYGLQAIIAAPPEKMPDIVPLVDETLCVVRKNHTSHVHNYQKER